MNRNFLITLLVVAGLLAILPFLVYWNTFGSSQLSTNLNTWYLFSNYLSGMLTPYFSLIAVITTIYIAFYLHAYERRKTEADKKQDDIASYLQLFQYFSAPEFREKRRIGWQVLRRAVINDQYAKHVVTETVTSRYIERVHRSKMYHIFEPYYKDIQDENEQSRMRKILHQESEDRHKLDAVINFFELLAIKDVPEDNYKVCDFYYDSWRPLLVWYAAKLTEAYNSHASNACYGNPPGLAAAIEKLDKKYYKPTKPELPANFKIADHPILAHFLANKQSDSDL